MSNTVISVEHLTKRYDLGIIGTGTLTRDLNRWWARLRGKPDPYTRIGQQDHFERIGETILALDDISFTVNQGEALGIIGKNGAGKSTLLKILSRVTAPTRGVVKVKGRIGSLLEIGTGFHPELTGRENIYLNGAILGMRKDEVDRKFDEIVDFSGVEKFIDTPVKRYSSGMYVRLAFAVAAHLDPEILVVDEVLAVGDAEFQKKCLGKMGDVAGEGRTVLFVSHNMAAIKKLCQRSILLQDGDLLLDDKANFVIGNYLKKLSTHNQNGEISEEAPRKFSTGEVKFRSVKLLNSKGENTSQLFLGERFTIESSLEVSKDIPKAAIEINIKSKDGIQIVSTRTLDGLNSSIYLQAGSQKICVEIGVFLLPREYYIELIVHRINGKILDWIEQSLSFNVQNVSKNSIDTYRYWPTIRGYVRPQANWILPNNT